MAKIVQAVPNFSEGREEEIYEAIVDIFRKAEDVNLLDYHSDEDHNRTVVTAIGAPEPVKKALFRATQKAAQLIDMEKHRGSHPRIGAADVIPFIPLRGMKMKEAVELAEKLGEEIAEKLGIPVYLYAEAARVPGREDLARIRRGEYERLKEEIDTPERRPDFGPAQMHPQAGATVVGARMPLVAYNVYLGTDDVSLAKSIARAVRGSSGGFVNVKAIGLDIEGRDEVQVSMNMVNFKETPLFRAYEFIKSEAENRGVSVTGSEIVGLVPQEALDHVAAHYLALRDFDVDEQVLENRLREEEG